MLQYYRRAAGCRKDGLYCISQRDTDPADHLTEPRKPITMITTNRTVVEVNASSVHTFTSDNSIMITDKSGDSIEIKGLTSEQMDSMAANWLRDRIRQDGNKIQKDRDFRLTILQTDLNNLWPIEAAA